MTLATYQSIPFALIERRQWINWAYETVKGNLTKVPYVCGTKTHAMTSEPSTWRDFTAAVNDRYERGIGFVFTSDDPFVGVDLDACRDPDSGFITDWATDVITTLDSYTEYSPSGKGVHVIVKAILPPGRRQNKLGGFYNVGRYFTMTGQMLPSAPTLIMERQSEIETLHARYLNDEAPERRKTTVHPSNASLSDDALLAKARNAKNGARFLSLWNGNTANHNDDESVADLALCCHLAFWFGPDTARIDRAFRHSGLYRDKWDERRPTGTYGSITIAKAIALTHEFYRPPEGNIAPPSITPNGHVPTQPIGPYARTDYGNAERLIARHGTDMRYCPPRKSWLVWNERYWEDDASNQVERFAKSTVRAIYAEAGSLADDEERKALAKHATRSESRASLKAMVDIAASEPTMPIEPAKLDADPWLLCVSNGTLDLRTGRLRPHAQGDFITKFVPVPYNPEAISPLWERFLADATGGDAELAAFLRRAVGYSLTGDTREEKLFFVHGPTSSGKSTFLDAVKVVLGSYAKTADFESFLAKRDSSGPRNDIARLVGARFVVSLEVDEGRRLAEGLVKMLTGGDNVTARELYGHLFEFKPAFKLWLAANAAPRARTDDDAIWRRIVRIPFDCTVPPEKRDPKIKLALRNPATAGPALLAWAVKGCLEWQSEGLKVPGIVRDSTDAYRIAVDRLAGFIEDCCELAPDAWITSVSLLAAYESWARDGNEKKLLRGRYFGERLIARGCKPERRHRDGFPVRGWLGIRLAQDGEDT